MIDEGANMQLGEAFIQLSVQLAPSAAKSIESDGKKAGDSAGQALTKAIEGAAAKMSLKAPDVSKAYGKAGQDAGAAMVKAVQSNVDKVKLTAPDAKAAYSKAGAEAGSALSKAVDTAANKITLKTPDIKNEYARAGTTAGKALADSVNSTVKNIDIKAPDVSKEYKNAGSEAGKALTAGVNETVKTVNVRGPDLKSEYTKAGTEAGKSLTSAVNSAVKTIKVDAPDVASEFSKEGAKAGTSFKDKLKGNLSGVSQFGSALGVQLIGAFNSEVNFSETTRRFQQQLGVTKTEAKSLGLAAGGLFANGLADGMDSAEEAISAVVNNISGIKEQGLPAIQAVAEGALGISKAFGQDLDATLRATGQLMRTGLAKDGKEALDLIAGGLQKIPGAAEDLLDTFTEYSVQFKKLGLDGKDALGIISQLMEGGARNTDLAADAMKEFSIRAVDGSRATEEAFQSLGLDADKLSRKFAEGGPEARKSFGEVIDALNKMEDPLKRTQAGMDLFGSQWEDLGDAFRKADLKTATKELGDLNGVANTVGGNTFGEKFKSNLSKLGGVATIVGGALGISFSASFDSAMDFKSSTEKVTRDLGLTVGEAKNVGKAAGAIYAAGLGDGLSDVTDAIGEVGKSLPSIAKEGVPALQEVTKAALILQKNFQVDIGDSANAVGKLIKTGLVKNATEGFDLIAAGMTKIPRAGEDLIDTVNEYSVQFQKLGLTGQDTFGLIKQLMEGGARDTDLAADALKEFSIRAVDGSTTSAAAFKSLGLNAKALTATFARGGPEARAAFGQVTDALNKMEDPVKRNAAGVGLFGTQWEDLGGAFKSVDLDKAAAGLGKIDGANKAVKASTPTQIVDQFKRSIESTFINVLADKVIPAFAKFITFMKDNSGLLKTLAISVAALGAAYVVLNTAMAVSAGGGLLTFIKTAVTSTKAWTAAQFALNLVMNANPIGIVITAVTALIAIIVVLYKNNETVRKIIDAAWKGIKIAISAVTDWFVKTAWPAMKKAWDEIQPTVQKVWDFIKKAWDGIKTALTSNEFLTNLKTQWENFKTTIQGVWKIISGAVQVAWAIIKGIFDTIKNILNGDFKAAWESLKTMISGVWDGIKKIISGVWDVIKSSVFGQIIEWIGGKVKQAWDNFKTNIGIVWDWIKTKVMAIWNWIRDSVFTPISDKLTWLKGRWELWKTALGIVLDAWKEKINTIWNWIRDQIFQVISDKLTWLKDKWEQFKVGLGIIWDWIKTKVTAVWNWIRDNIFQVISDKLTWLKGKWAQFKVDLGIIWDWIKTKILAIWNWIRDNVFAKIDEKLTWLKGKWVLWKTAIGIVLDQWKEKIKTVWDWVKNNVFTPITNFVTKTIPDAFRNGVDAVGKAWDKIKDSVKKPVVFVVNTVLRDGIVKGFNAIASKVGVGTIDFKGMSTGGVVPAGGGGRATALATGGVLPGYTPGRDVHRFVSPTGGSLALSGGEAVMRPEFTRAVGPATVNALNGAARSGGVAGVKRALGLASGGIVGFKNGGVVGTVSGWWEDLSGMVKSAASTIGEMVGRAKNSSAVGWLGDVLKHTVSTLMTGVKNTVIGSHTGGGGGAATSDLGNVAGGGGYQWQIGVLRKAFPGVQVYSTTGGKHATGSYHYRGRAVDITPSMAIFNWIKKNYGAKTQELIYGPAGGQTVWHGKNHNYSPSLMAAHYNHVHWAYDSGGWLEPGMTGINKTGKPEAVLTPDESKGLKNMGVGELADLLRELIEAVERIAPGVTAGIRGAGAGLRVAGRSV